MNLQELDKMARRWPPETPAIIGRHETRRAKLQQARREQQPFTVPKDYGSDTPIKPLFSRIWQSIKNQMADEDKRIEAVITLTVCGVVALFLMTLFAVMPASIDGLIEHQRQAVEESRR